MSSHNDVAPAEVLADATYDAGSIWFHWGTVGLILTLWVIGLGADGFPRGPLRSGAWSLHVVLGFCTTLVLLARGIWRLSNGRALPPANTGALQVLTRLVHFALYALLAAAVVTGIANASYRGISLFGVTSVPQFGAGEATTRRAINEVHEIAVNVLLLAAAFHAGAALVHHYVWRDRILLRMWPASRAK